MNHQLSYHQPAIHTFHKKSQRCFHHGLVFITLFLWFSSRKNQFHWDLPPPSCKSAEWRQATPLGAMQIQVSSYRDATFTTGLFWGRKTMGFFSPLALPKYHKSGWEGMGETSMKLSVDEGRIESDRKKEARKFSQICYSVSPKVVWFHQVATVNLKRNWLDHISKEKTVRMKPIHGTRGMICLWNLRFARLAS